MNANEFQILMEKISNYVFIIYCIICLSRIYNKNIKKSNEKLIITTKGRKGCGSFISNKGVVTVKGSVQFSCSVMSSSLRPHGLQHARPPCPSPKFISIESVMPSNHLILCCSLLLPPLIFPSIRVFSNESVLRIR